MSSIFPGGGSTQIDANSIEQPVVDSIKNWSSYPAQTNVNMNNRDLLNVDELVATSICGDFNINLDNRTFTNSTLVSATLSGTTNVPGVLQNPTLDGTTLTGTTTALGVIQNPTLHTATLSGNTNIQGPVNLGNVIDQSYQGENYWAGNLTIRSTANPGRMRFAEAFGTSYIQSDGEIRFSDYASTNQRFSVYETEVYAPGLKAGGSSVSAPLIDASSQFVLNGLLNIPAGGGNGIKSLGKNQFSGEETTLLPGNTYNITNDDIVQNKRFFCDFTSSTSDITLNFTPTGDDNTAVYGNIKVLVVCLATGLPSNLIINSTTGAGVYGMTTNNTPVENGGSVQCRFDVLKPLPTIRCLYIVDIYLTASTIYVENKYLSTNTGLSSTFRDVDISGVISHIGDISNDGTITTTGTITATDGVFYDVQIQNDLTTNGNALFTAGLSGVNLDLLDDLHANNVYTSNVLDVGGDGLFNGDVSLNGITHIVQSSNKANRYAMYVDTGVFQINPRTSTGAYNSLNTFNMNSTGNINIGSTTFDPTFPFSVKIFNAAQTLGYARWIQGQSTILVGPANSQWSAYFERTIYATTGMVVSSDERIKKNIVDIEDGEALEKLRALKPKKYEYIDYVNNGTQPVYGFIAQDVKEVIPYAVKEVKQIIPDYYEPVEIVSQTPTTITFKSKVYDVNSGDVMEVIANIEGERRLQGVVSMKTTDKITLTFEKETGTITDLFVYGKEVKDFNSLKKDHIWTIAVSALQEIDRLQTQHEARIKAIEDKLGIV